MKINELLKKIGCRTTDGSEQKTLINLWLGWYKGTVSNFHNFYIYNGQHSIRMTKKTLNTAKQVCETFADLLFNDNVKIALDTEEKTAKLNNLLKSINFNAQVSEAIEKSFALGTGAIIVVKEKDGISLSYVYADDIYPISYNNNVITECAFKTFVIKDQKKYVYLSIHQKKNGVYVITNAIYQLITDDTLGQLVDMYEYNTKSDTPFFCIIKPGLANNAEMYSPFGISIFANAISELEAIDEAYNSLDLEVKNGKLKVLVSSENTNIVSTPGGGSVVPVFDSNDTVFHILPKSMNDNKSIDIIAPTLRIDAFVQAINASLKLLSSKVGLGSDFYSYEQAVGVKTATEVISKDSQMFRRIKKHEHVLEYALTNIILAICKASNINATSVSIDFDDSIVQDKEAERSQDLLDVNAGLLEKWEYRAKWYNEDEETAKKHINDISEGVVQF